MTTSSTGLSFGFFLDLVREAGPRKLPSISCLQGRVISTGLDRGAIFHASNADILGLLLCPSLFVFSTFLCTMSTTTTKPICLNSYSIRKFSVFYCRLFVKNQKQNAKNGLWSILTSKTKTHLDIHIL